MKRRCALSLGGSLLLTTVAGCSALRSNPSQLNMTLFNKADSPYTIEMSLFGIGDNQPRSEARAYSESIDVEPGGKAEREHVAEARRYLIRYEAYESNSHLTDEDHVHFYPSGNEGDDSVSFDIHSPGVLTRR